MVAVHVWPAEEPSPVAVDELVLDFGGPVGDRHHGVTAISDVREKWLYPRGTAVRNNRQVSLVDTAELAIIAGNLGLPELAPGTIADNICTRGLADLADLPPLSRLVFGAPGDTHAAVLVVFARNNPCTIAGELVQMQYGVAPQRFPKASINHRGITAWVERPGVVRADTPVRTVGVRAVG